MIPIDISAVINWLNNERGMDLSDSYYAQIQIWEQWWRGYYKPFHCFRETQGTRIIERKLYTLKMAKKVCEDWASILLNDKTEIVVDDKQSSAFLQGEDGTGGVFRQVNFWLKGNELIEKAFYSGSGAFVLKLDGMPLRGEEIVSDQAARIRLEYLPGSCIIPLTIRGGAIVEAAFASRVIEKGIPYIYLEAHELDDDGQYVIKNYYFKTKDQMLERQKLPEGVAETFFTRSPTPFFSIVTPNIVNNIANNNGLGISVFANALDNLMGVDLAYNNFCRDFYLGGKKVFYNKSLVQSARDDNGNMVSVAPDDVMQQLFLQMGEDDNLDVDALIHEFNPSLRVVENKDGVQAQLDYLSFKCGLGTKHYQFNAGSVVTATQYMGDKQELVQNASKHYIVVESALQQIVRALLWAGKTFLGAPVNPDANITVNFSDSYLIDDDTKRAQDKEDIRDGIMQKWEYRVKWYGEDELTAKAMAGNDDGLHFGDGDG
ncbi:hypothetical protein [Anaerotruncus sp. AF02-27]|uniref:hypothetical protein n=1 Tax=Anaerotruncus sp. AF02-27 TaxID=2292191 RepID=UPI001FA8F2B7|nr:hypothetical protein [Anaerotruncus sp. AF02-27]